MSCMSPWLFTSTALMAQLSLHYSQCEAAQMLYAGMHSACWGILTALYSKAAGDATGKLGEAAHGVLEGRAQRLA